MRVPLTLAALAISLGGPAEAHWSASAGRSLHTHRYLICTDHPDTKVHCAGPIHARDALLAALAGNDANAFHSAAIDAAYFNVKAAIPALRTQLARRVAASQRGTHDQIEINSLRAEAAYALAQLGDRDVAPAIAALVREFETEGSGFLWKDTLAALAVIDAPAASHYAIDFFTRASDFRTSLPGGSSKLDALAYIRREDAATALPVISRLGTQEERGYDHAECEFKATRVRIDDAFRAKVRTALVGSYSGSWLAGCANSVFAQLGSPADPADLPALIRHLGRDDAGMDFGMANLAYQRILDVEAAGRLDAPGRELLRRGLDARSKWPHVADPKSANYALHFVVLHHAALAGLGDGSSRAKLFAILDDPGEHTGSAWLAALWALRLDLPDAHARVGELLARAAVTPQTERTGIFEHLRTRVLEAFVARYPNDPRWTVMLLDGDTGITAAPSDAAERALYLVARHAPIGTCVAVTTAARDARVEAVEHAFLALSALGTGCGPELVKLADDRTAKSELRGTAIEILGAIGDPLLGERIRRGERDKVWRPSLDRARLWLRR